jgi:uncharacterized protein YvpB
MLRFQATSKCYFLHNITALYSHRTCCLIITSPAPQNRTDNQNNARSHKQIHEPPLHITHHTTLPTPAAALKTIEKYDEPAILWQLMPTSTLLLRIPAAVIALLCVGVIFSGTTHAQSVRLPVDFHRQELRLSCEVATLKMALSALNIDIPESELRSQLSYDPTPKSSGVWGNPHKGFVGDINGRMLRTGYGVYAQPIAKLGNKYAATQVISQGSPELLARHLAAGNPVIIWGYYGAGQTYTWRTPDGTPVHAVDGEHTYIVYGFDGPLDNPITFSVMDPLKGSQTWSAADLAANWSALNRMGVVVIKHPLWVRVPGEKQVWELSAGDKTRRWVSTWDDFVKRGGAASLVTPIDKGKLETYTLGSPIT